MNDVERNSLVDETSSLRLDNAAIAARLTELAELLEFRGENPFRIRAYHAASRTIADLDESVSELLDQSKRDLADLPGIGQTLAEKVATLCRTGSLPQLEELRQAVPGVVIAMARIPGLGAKKATKLHQTLQIDSLDELAAACRDGRVAATKGFGKKSQEAILTGMAIATAASERLYWATADELACDLLRHMQRFDGVTKMQWAGSYRRGRETVGDLDLVAVADDRAGAMDHFEAYPGRVSTIARGATKISIRVGSAFQIDLRLVDSDQFGAALQYFTGSQAHNIHLRRRAKDQGLKLNEYGVFRIQDDVRVGGETEADVYGAVGLPVYPPELREDRREFDWTSAEQIPSLIEVDQIIGDLHMHTSSTDGENTIAEMAEAAIARGLRYIAITDHSQRVSVARGLSARQVLDQWRIIDDLRPEFADRITILKGIECDILEAGGMDFPDDVLAQADWVIASVHFGQKQSRQQITERILGAIENPTVHCVAHPTGRLIHRREPYALDFDAVVAAACEHGVCLELNANPARLDLDDVHLMIARQTGARLVINTDAHNREGLDVMRYGVMQARRAGLTADDFENSRPVDALLSWRRQPCRAR